MTKPKKGQYRIQYVDNTYQIVDWTKVEFTKVGKYMEELKQAVTLGDGIFKVSDIRAIVFLPPIPELTKEEIELQKEKELSEWGGYDPEVTEWLKKAGIDTSKGVN